MKKSTKRAIHELDELGLKELQARFREVVGESTRCPNRVFLVRRISEALAVRDARAELEPTPSTPVDSGPVDSGPVDSGPVVEFREEPAEDVEFAEEANPEGQPAEGQPAEGQPAEGQPAEGQPAEGANREDAPEQGEQPVSPSAREWDPPPRPRPERGRYTRMTVEELRREYLRVIGRPTSSVHRAYLSWKLREADKGRITVGPVEPRTSHATDARVLPLRLDCAFVERIDAAWRQRGLPSRMEFFRRALGKYLEDMNA